jgi:hypothetical protein
MSKLTKSVLAATLLALVLGLAFNLAPVKAADTTFNIYVKHNINGRSLGLEKALPVDVYVNDGYAFTFSFGDSFSAALPAGNYKIDVKLAGTNITVMSLGPVEIPAGVNVNIQAQLSGGKTPVLRVNIK